MKKEENIKLPQLDVTDINISFKEIIKGSSPRMTFEDLKRDDRFCQDFFRKH